MEATVGSIKKGSPPTLEQFEYDESKYENAGKEYYSAPKAKPKAKEEEENKARSNDEAEFYLNKNEEKLAEKMPQDKANKQGFIHKLKYK